MTDYTNPDVNYVYDPDCPPGKAYFIPEQSQHTHQIAPAGIDMVNEILKAKYGPTLAEQLYRPTMISKLMEVEAELEAKRPDFYGLCADAAQNHAVVLLNAEEWDGQWMESYERNEIMTIWQPLADAGYDNFIVDDDEIVVKVL